VVIIFSFGPPLIISLVYPDIFLEALDVVGGFGIVILFGILPAIIGIMKARRLASRLFCILILLLFIGFLGLEIMQEFGFLKIHPHIEHWDTMQGILKNNN